MKIEKQNPGFAKRVKSWLTGKYVENGSTASQNIPAGKWVTWKGQVCRAKSAITMGDTLSSANLDVDEEGIINADEWVYLDSFTPSGGANITLPDGWREIQAIAWDSSSRNYTNGSVIVPKKSTPSTGTKTYQAGMYFASNNCGAMQVILGQTSITGGANFHNGSSNASGPIDIYYR